MSGDNRCPITGIDWDWYDNGPGSENHKRKMAAEKAEYDKRFAAEEAAKWKALGARIADLEADNKGLRKRLAKLAKYEVDE